MAERRPIVKKKSEEPANLVIEGAGQFHGRPDGKTSGRGMLGLISAIPPAPKLPNIRGVRMLAPTVPSLRPLGLEPEDRSLPPLGLPDEQYARDADGKVALRDGEDDADDAGESAESADEPAEDHSAPLRTAGPEGKPTWVRFATLLIIALALGSIPVLHALLTGD